MAQRLAGAASQYLRQHAHQPVDWFPYGDEAFEQARLRDVPVMLSIGYAACHWCHVMSHESFDDPQIAQMLNENFVAIKVDREEHPLVDDTYMMATQALTGAGGWPMTIFALPDGRTVHAGTYYPKEPRGRTPGFSQVLQAVHEAWETKREGLEEQADMLAEHLAELGSRQSALLTLESREPAESALSSATERWILSTKPEGGFTQAPKFPPTWALKTLWHSVITRQDSAQEAFNAAATSLEAMFLGGLHDHIDGGFARYCVDENWSVPHFEKMLYDNAGLLSLAARSTVLADELMGRASGDESERAQKLAGLARRSAEGIIGFLEEELLIESVANPAFAASLDADSARDAAQIEGAYYSYNREQINQATEALLARLPQGLIRFAPIAEDPEYYCFSLARMPEAAEQPVVDELVAALKALRSSRIRPVRDEKIVAGWNALAIEALCDAFILLEESKALALAERVATSLWNVHFDEVSGRLARVSFAGRPAENNEGTLQDYAALAVAFLSLQRATGEQLWEDRANRLLARARDFVDPATGVPRDAVEVDARISAQRSDVAAVSVLDDALPAAGALYAKALAMRAVQGMSESNYTESHAADLERARVLSAHAVALASVAATQVATALEVQTMISSPVHYLALGSWDSAQAMRVRKLAWALGISVHHAPELGGEDTLKIQPCRQELCQMPVEGIEQLLGLLQVKG
ncbi:thioredoxin domain-containing protein [Glutamicibacter mishrai]|uniref:thioredoxin domain-containing protein n=1 Tax=Glutamicibacter mishrai TaxID=1775880 RepID=UPI0032EBEEA4